MGDIPASYVSFRGVKTGTGREKSQKTIGTHMMLGYTIAMLVYQRVNETSVASQHRSISPRGIFRRRLLGVKTFVAEPSLGSLGVVG